MESKIISAPVQTLIEYSRQNAATEDVLRALIGHQGWLAPAMLFAREQKASPIGERQFTIDKPIIKLSEDTVLSSDELWVFTDKDAAEKAQSADARLGLYAKEVSGTELFGEKIDPGLQIVRVNPYSPPEQSWQLQNGSFELVSLWSQAVALEESFLLGKLDFKAISKFPGYTVLNHSSGYTVTLPDKGGMTNPAVAFTTPDCADAFLSKLNGEQREGLKRVVTDGLTLIKKLPAQGIDGILFNVYGPGAQSYFAFSEIENLTALEENLST